jgi:hypothetical protein
MKPVLLLLLIASPLSLAADTRTIASSASEVVHVATALDHVTVLELGEPVNMVAAGSPAFEVERHEDKVLIKPLRAGCATDLLVWTPTRRLIYELEAPGEVAKMSFAVDSRLRPAKGIVQPAERSQESVDSVLERAFLAALPVDGASTREAHDAVTLRFEHLLLSKNRLYIHYSLKNRGKGAYRPGAPTIERLVYSGSAVAFRQRSQISSGELRKFKKSLRIPVTGVTVQTTATELGPGERAEGVIAIAQPLAPGSVIELTLAFDGKRRVEAALVL